MEVECVFFGPLRKAAGTQETTWTLDEGATVIDLIETLVAENDGLEERLLTEEGDLRGTLNVTVDKRNVRQLDGASTALSDGDTVRISPSIRGG